MSTEIILENKHLILEYFRKGGYVIENWWDRVEGKEFYDLINDLELIYIMKGIKGIIVDAREYRDTEPEFQKKLADQVKKYATKRGALKHAVVVNSNMWKSEPIRFYIENIHTIERVSKKVFNSLSEAIRWMEE